MVKRLCTLFLTAIVGSVSAVAVATPANALVEVYRNANSVWANSGIAHWWGLDNFSYHDGDTFSDGYHLYDQASSALNSTPSWTCFYNDHPYSGSFFGLNGYVGFTNFAGSIYQDELSSNDYNAAVTC